MRIFTLILILPLLMTFKVSAAQQNSEIEAQTQSIVLGLGCFWGAEKRFAKLPGVINVVSGYADGKHIAPNYKAITSLANRFKANNFAEVIEVTFDAKQIALETIIKRFFEWHDPTQGYRQGNDVGSQYRSIVLYNSAAQRDVVESLKASFQVLLHKAGYEDITTEIKPLERFYPAEEYHQDYLVKNPNGYCPDHSTGVVFDDADAPLVVDNTALLSGKHIVVIVAPDCPYCERFKRDVADHYQGQIKMHFRLASQLQELEITSPTWATPTLLFLNDGKERFGIQGYVNNIDFYKALGHFELGDSEAFNVAFQKGTDARFCRQYEKFKNTPDGQFIDVLSGVALFDTKDRFNSGTGWLSFRKALPDAVTYHEDNSYGMNRTEVRAAISGIHLGHVFNDGPNGSPRYCINATVLDFKPRKQ